VRPCFQKPQAEAGCLTAAGPSRNLPAALRLVLERGALQTKNSGLGSLPRYYSVLVLYDFMEAWYF